MKRILIFLILTLIFSSQTTGQIIDVHMHGYTKSDFWDGGKARNGLDAALSADDLIEKTIQQMDEHNINYAVLCGKLETLEKYTKADSRFIPGYQDYEDTLIDINRFEDLVKAGKIKVFGEVMAVYHGRTLTDSIYQPYLKICEKYGIPVAYHTGGSFPDTQNLGWPKFRISFGDPLLIEDVLVKFPKLKLYLMHAGDNFYENTLRMMDGYPNLYVDLGVLLWIHPSSQDYAIKFLGSAKKYGFLDRIMFGSDQMVWPDAITSSIDFFNSLEFLSDADKEMILYKNAKEFLGIKD